MNQSALPWLPVLGGNRGFTDLLVWLLLLIGGTAALVLIDQLQRYGLRRWLFIRHRIIRASFYAAVRGSGHYGRARAQSRQPPSR